MLFIFILIDYKASLFKYFLLIILAYLAFLAHTKVFFFSLALFLLSWLFYKFLSSFKSLLILTKPQLFSYIIYFILIAFGLYFFVYLRFTFDSVSDFGTLLFTLSAGRLGSGCKTDDLTNQLVCSSRHSESWSLVLSDAHSLFFGHDPSNLSMIGDSGIFISMWIGGLTFSLIYIIALFILFTRILTIPAIRATPALFTIPLFLLFVIPLFVFFPFTMQNQLSILFPTVFIILYQSISTPVSLNPSAKTNNAS